MGRSAGGAAMKIGVEVLLLAAFVLAASAGLLWSCVADDAPAQVSR